MTVTRETHKLSPFRSIAIAAAALLAIIGQSPGVARAESVVMGYLAAWNTGEDGRRIAAINGERLTHVIYAFGAVTADGVAALGDPCADIGRCGSTPAGGGNFARLAAMKAANPRLKLLVSIGGWTGSGYFSDVAASEQARRRFVASAIDLFILDRPGLFDGIDIDWEFPVSGGLESNAARPADRHNFTLLMAEFRRQLDALPAPAQGSYELGIAVPGSPDLIENFEPAALSELVDWVNVMAYDYHTGGETSHFNAPLYAIPGDPTPESNVASSIDAYIDAGVPRRKLVLGMAFFGRGYGRVASTRNGLLQQADPAAAGLWGADGIDYADLVTRQPLANGFRQYWNEHAEVPFLYNAAKRIWITYDDPRSIRSKASFAKRLGLGGVMFWELGGDDGSLLEAASQELELLR